MSQKERIVHKQHFQNAQQTVEILIKAKPKPKIGFKTKKPSQNPFVRDCILKKELDKLTMEDQENHEDIAKTQKSKTRRTQVGNTIQISKKNRSRKKKHDILPPDTTWREHLEKYRPTSNISSSANSDSQSIFSKSDNSHKSSASYANDRMNIKKSASMGTTIKPSISQPDKPMPLADCNQKININKSVQTSFQTPSESTSRNKSSNKPSHISINQPKSSVDQTQSPFGISALQLLQQLRERLRSKGDSEGSEIVGAIEACFGSAGGKAGNLNMAGAESNVSPLFPSVFPTPHAPTHASDQTNENLKRIILEQQKEIKEQADTIQDLNYLSAKLLALHEQLSQQIVEEESNSENCKKPKLKTEDSGVELSSSDDVHRALKNLTMERETLLKEVKGQRDIILKLEIKLDHASRELEAMKRSNVLSSHSASNGSLHSGHQPPAFQNQVRDAQAGRPVSNPSRLLCHTPNESEADSAFEEKSSKSSGVASNISNRNLLHENREKVNAPPTAVMQEQYQPNVGIDSNGRSTEMISKQPKWASQQNLGIDHNQRNTETNGKIPDQDSPNTTPRSHYKTLLKNSEGQAPFVGLTERIKESAIVRPTVNASLSLLSDLSSDNNRSSSVVLEEHHLSHKDNGAGNETPLSETPVLAPSGYYLESTHVHKGMLSGSPSKPLPLQRRLLHTEFSPLDATGERAELEPEVCSKEDEYSLLL